MTILKEKTIRKKKKLGEVAIDLRGVGKKYIIHHEKPTLAEDVGRKLRFQKSEEYWALKNVNLKIHQGSKIGFYGPNGAGKTTLLKIIAGISTPTEGKVRAKGRVISLIDLEAGFHPDLTGQENIFLNGLVLGMSKKEIQSKFAQIVAFADIGDFITAPMNTYSNGMKLRLGFSVAIHANPDIVLLDEVMNMGDEDFRKKSETAINTITKGKVTTIMVSQWIGFLEEFCDVVVEIKPTGVV